MFQIMTVNKNCQTGAFLIFFIITELVFLFFKRIAKYRTEHADSKRPPLMAASCCLYVIILFYFADVSNIFDSNHKLLL